MVGSSDSIASANTVLNTIIAEAFKEAADKLEKADNFDMAVHDMIKGNPGSSQESCIQWKWLFR